MQFYIVSHAWEHCNRSQETGVRIQKKKTAVSNQQSGQDVFFSDSQARKARNSEAQVGRASEVSFETLSLERGPDSLGREK